MVERLDDMENMDDDDLLETLLSDESGDSPLPTTKDVASLEEAIASKDKEIQGLLSATKEERRKRQDTAAKLNQLTDTVNGILSTRQQQGIESMTNSETAEAKSLGLPVVYDDEGNAWVDQTGVDQLLSPYTQEINNLKQQLQLNGAQSAALDAAEKIKQGIIGEDERYAPAANRYRAARKWVEDQVAAYANANGKGVMAPGQALDEIFGRDKGLMDEFNNSFEGMDVADVIFAEESEYNFRRTIGNIASSMEAPAEAPGLAQPKEVDSRFQKVLNKPSTLGNQANAKAGQLSIMDKLGNLSPSEMLEFTDEQMASLMKAVEREQSS